MPSRIALAALISDSPCVLKNTSRSAVSFSSKMRRQSSERVNSSPVSSFIRAICSPQAHPLPGRAISLKSSSTIIIFGLCFAIVANSLKKCLLKSSSYGQQTYSVLPFAMPTYCVKGDASSSGYPCPMVACTKMPHSSPISASLSLNKSYLRHSCSAFPITGLPSGTSFIIKSAQLAVPFSYCAFISSHISSTCVLAAVIIIIAVRKKKSIKK